MPDHSTFVRFSSTLHCNYFLEVGALVVLVAITIAYFSRKKFPVATARLFGVGLISLILNVSSDILFCMLLDHSDVIPIIYAELVADFFFSMQFVLSYSLFAFVLYSVGKTLKDTPLYILTILPSAVGAVLFFTNPIHHWNFSFVLDEVSGTYDFLPGPTFMSLYVINWGLNCAATLAYTIAFRKKLPKEVLRALISVIAVVLIAAVIQTIQPTYLLSGTAFALCALFAVSTVCDPDVKVDRVSHAFNDYAFIDYLNTQRFEKQRKHYIILDIESFGLFSEKFGTISANELIYNIRKIGIKQIN